MEQSKVITKTIDECDVQLIVASGSDFMPAIAARVSFGKDLQDLNEARDIKLMRYLAEHQHMSCFEHQTATFMIECPLFIRSQIQRHRTFSYNEISRRYTSEELGFWVPALIRGQAKDNKQGSVEPLEDQSNLHAFTEIAKYAQADYQTMLDEGVCREQARALLPQSLLTRFYMTGNLRNWAHFLELRLDSHAQLEVQTVARRILEKLQEVWPESLKALNIA